ncbi:hypothetical protein [Lactiplantibacillus mudanjiangensis]|uniref:Uncharacterized protein n=1 Tax=Lactiplantibacillus mudanjiangensis TaxID=1296538 RepID=A0A660E1S4_9LACO|nr:hypothetical protein [Lactiplantibacillus mudanjiangensis]VDG22708.1 hypothetical protein MUDAN_IGPPGNFN_00251 [Lactiplantibacillus mudanjiangensis]VDG26754.1 hypothetical protein MUDAN_MDHGFNIF_00157 [Lactiplantibacillus mudanjiangensis]
MSEKIAKKLATGVALISSMVTLTVASQTRAEAAKNASVGDAGAKKVIVEWNYRPTYQTSYKYVVNKQWQPYKNTKVKIDNVTAYHATGKNKTFLLFTGKVKVSSKRETYDLIASVFDKRVKGLKKGIPIVLLKSAKKKFPNIRFHKVDTDIFHVTLYSAYPTITPSKNNFTFSYGSTRIDNMNAANYMNPLDPGYYKKWVPMRFVMYSTKSYGKMNRIGKIKLNILQGQTGLKGAESDSSSVHLKQKIVSLNLNKTAK